MIKYYSLLHVISAVIWVGGMFFAYNFLRPAIGKIDVPAIKLTLWSNVFKRFFPIVWVSVILLPITGYMMMFSIWGGMGATPLYVHIMNGVGTVMILIYLYLYFVPYKNLNQAVANEKWPDAANAHGKIRILVAINTTLGLLVVMVASGGRFL